MVTSLQVVTFGFVGLLGVASFLLLLLRTRYGTGIARAVDRFLRAVSTRGNFSWLDWRLVLLVCGAAYAAVIAFDLTYGLFACSGKGPSDILGLLASGRAVLNGKDPFTVSDCGGSLDVPYGLAAVVIDVIGSPGGVIGIAAVWGLVALALIPLTWVLAGPDRRYVTLVVASSLLFLPLVSAQIDGASNALVPTAVLVTVVLARRKDAVASAVGGFLATGRFPTVFPMLGGAGQFRQRVLSIALVIAVFAAVTAASYATWGSSFLTPVFLSQVTRRSFSLNLYGLLGQRNWLPAGDGVAIVQAALTVAVVVAVWWKGTTVLGATAITLTGVALVTQFLSFNILVWLLPVVLLGARARWWLWGIALIGTVNYDIAYPYWGVDAGIWGPYDLLGVALTVLLLGLFVDLWRQELGQGNREVGLTTS